MKLIIGAISIVSLGALFLGGLLLLFSPEATLPADSVGGTILICILAPLLLVGWVVKEEWNKLG